MSSFPVSTSHNIASSCGSADDLELGYVNPSEEQSELVESGRRGALPGLPGGPALGDPEPEIPDEVLDALLAARALRRRSLARRGAGACHPPALDRALEAELTAHLGYAAGQAPRGGSGNSRNGKPSKTLITDHGPLRISSPRMQGYVRTADRQEAPDALVGFDEKVISLYARG